MLHPPVCSLKVMVISAVAAAVLALPGGLTAAGIGGTGVPQDAPKSTPAKTEPSPRPTRVRPNGKGQDVPKSVEASVQELRREFELGKLRTTGDYFEKNPNAELTPAVVLQLLGRPLGTSASMDAYIKWQVVSALPRPASVEARAAVAGILRSGLRTSDVLCRHGGEEFAILLPETLPSRAIGVAERLRAQLGEASIPIREGGDVRITASFGIAGADRVGDDTIDDLLRSADQAMYRAKAAGRNCIFTAPPKSA